MGATTAEHNRSGNGAGAAAGAPAQQTEEPKKRRTRKATEGKRITFLVSDDAYAALEAEAKKDFRTADNLAMVATMKYVNGLSASGS